MKRIKKVGVSDLPANEGKIIDSFNTSDDKHTNAPSLSAVEEKFTYSTTEKRVGTWIDGKPIYRKTIQIGSLPNNTTVTISHNIANFERPTNIEISWYDAVDDRWYITNRSAGDVRVFITCNNTNIIVQAVGTNWAIRTSNCVVTIEYTKTTD